MKSWDYSWFSVNNRVTPLSSHSTSVYPIVTTKSSYWRILMAPTCRLIILSPCHFLLLSTYWLLIIIILIPLLAVDWILEIFSKKFLVFSIIIPKKYGNKIPVDERTLQTIPLWIRFHKDNLRHHPRFPLIGLANNRFSLFPVFTPLFFMISPYGYRNL